MTQEPERFYEVVIELKGEFSDAVRAAEDRKIWHLKQILARHDVTMVSWYDTLCQRMAERGEDDPYVQKVRGILADAGAKRDFSRAYQLVRNDHQLLSTQQKNVLMDDLDRPSVKKYLYARQWWLRKPPTLQ